MNIATIGPVICITFRPGDDKYSAYPEVPDISSFLEKTKLPHPKF